MSVALSRPFQLLIFGGLRRPALIQENHTHEEDGQKQRRDPMSAPIKGWRYALMNRTKTLILLATLTALLLGAGQALAGNAGLAIAVIVALVLNFGSYWFSDKVVLRMYGAREVEENDAVRLYAIVRDLAARADLPMPKVYLIPEAAPNAFATGRNPQHAAVAVTEGLLRKLDRNELAAVIAHELAHIKNRDTLIMTVAATIAGALSMLANTAMWGMMLGSGRSSGDDRDSSPLGGLLAVIVAPFLALLIQMAISRSREFLADESGARISGDPLALASALGKMEALSRDAPIYAGSPATAHLFIVNPFSGGVLVNLFSTHPRTEVRIQRLQALMVLAPTSDTPPQPTAARRIAK
jgi:heat shock protein HtpX